MAHFVAQMPTLTLTSSAVDTSTQAVTAWENLEDAESLHLSFTGTTTAPGVQIQVAYTSHTTATFVPLVAYQSTGVLSSGIFYISSTGLATAFALWPVGYKQLRIGTSNVTSTQYSLNGMKKFQV